MFVLVATDAAGEGVNLQRAHLLVNYDLPWNPNRIEQRFGRIHRIGQTEVCHMWNLVAFETREGQVFQRLLEKLAEQSKALGGRVFDVLGDEIFEDPLRDLLIEAVRYGDQPEVRARLDEIVDAAVGEKLKAALKERALLTEMMSATDVEEIREQMEEAEARKLQPHYIRVVLPRGVPAARRPDLEARAGPLRDHATSRPRSATAARRSAPASRSSRATRASRSRRR